MQKSNANETAKEIIKNAKLVFGDRIRNISLYSVTDEPYKMFSLKFTVYDYYIIVCNYDRGHFGCSTNCCILKVFHLYKSQFLNAIYEF